MNVTLTPEWKLWVERKIQAGEYPSEEAVLVAALIALKGQESPTMDDQIDTEFEASCAREGDDSITLEEVLEATSKIPGSMASFIIDEERAERF